MDDRLFDILSRRLGRATTRRTALRGLFGGAIGVAGSVALGAGDVAAACSPDGARCNRNAGCCSGSCAWTTVTRGRRKTRFGTCIPAGPTTCTPDSWATECLVTRRMVLQVCNEGPLTEGTGGCLSDMECEHFLPGCGSTDYCFCRVGHNDLGGYQPDAQPVCSALPYDRLCGACG